MTEHLTYQWLNPILIGIIGWMIRNYLASVEKKVSDIEDKVTKHIEKIEFFIKETNERHFDMDKRVSLIENIGDRT